MKKRKRNASGQFLKRHSNPKKKAGSARRRRRSNPAGMVPLLVANPRKKRHARRTNPSLRKVRAMVTGIMRRKRPTRKKRARVSNPTKKWRRTSRRRSNPMMGTQITFAQVVRIGVAGALGSITARIAGYLYNKYAAAYVIGEANRANPSHWRAWLSDAVRIVVQEIAVIGIQHGMKKAGVGTPIDRLAYLVGGSAETARTILGIGMSRIAPTVPRAAVGLDGPDGVNFYQEPDGRIMVWSPEHGQFLLDEAATMAGLERDTAFDGLEPGAMFDQDMDGAPAGYGG